MIRLILVCIGFSLASLDAMALDIACPEKIVTSQKLVKRVQGWQSFVRPNGEPKERNGSSFLRIDLYDGNPKEIAQLKPDDDNSKEHVWTFSAPITTERPIYMSCVYSSTRLEFIQALPLTIKKCTAKRNGILRCNE